MKNSLVIIVEDDAPLRQGLSDWLSEEHEVSSFGSAEEFLLALKNIHSKPSRYFSWV